MTIDERIAEIKRVTGKKVGFTTLESENTFLLAALQIANAELSTLTAQRDEAIRHVRALLEFVNTLPINIEGFRDSLKIEAAKAFLATLHDADQPFKATDSDIQMFDKALFASSEELYVVGPTDAGKTPNPISTLFDAIAHGDEKHRAWLKQAIEDHFAGRPVVRPDAGQTADAKRGDDIEALSRAMMQATAKPADKPETIEAIVQLMNRQINSAIAEARNAALDEAIKALKNKVQDELDECRLTTAETFEDAVYTVQKLLKTQTDGGGE